MQIGVLTGGGDCPGLNAVIKGIVTKAISHGYDVIGFRKGWAGLLGSGEHHPLDLDKVENIHTLGGTILGTSRTNPYKEKNGVEQIKKNLKKFKCDALIAIGGEDTLGVANKLNKDGINVVGVPKTIDNDLSATDYTFGFDTSVNVSMDAIDRLHTTTKSHERCMVVEIMGRHAGWLTLHAGMAGGAHIILLPEEKFSMDRIAEKVKKRQNDGKMYTLIAASEGAMPEHAEDFITQDKELDAFGHVKLGGIGKALAKEIEKRTGIESRHVVLGHLQRGGTPTAFDRILGIRLGVKAADLVHEKKFGQMASLMGTQIVSVDLSEAVATLKVVDKDRINEMKLFGGE